LLLAAGLAAVTTELHAWGYEGHSRVGRVALSAIDGKAALYLREILDGDLPKASDEACNWPDDVRPTPEWEWSAPQHYVNIPRSASEYDRGRDCPDGLCVTEAIKKYAARLSDPKLDAEQRWQAYAWLCHLVGDLHQPLHAGYKDDRGANRVVITFRGEEGNLHAFWDSMLIDDRLGKPAHWPAWSAPATIDIEGNTWNPVETDEWTGHSHQLAANVAYPENFDIQPDFADRSWRVIQEQVITAGYRLARILNAAVGGGEVVLDR
jgi:hypothetical protein